MQAIINIKPGKELECRLAMRLLFHLFIGSILLLALAGIWAAICQYGVTWYHSPLRWPIIAGTVVGLILDGILRRRAAAFETFEHELTHALAGIPFGQIPYRLIVRDGGGLCKQVGCTPALLAPFAMDFIALAPYVLPTFTVILVGIRPLLPIPWLPWTDLVTGVTFGYHTFSTLREIPQNWSGRAFTDVEGNPIRSDIAQTGHLFSAVYIVAVTLAIHGLLLAILLKGYPGITAWWQIVSSHTLPLMQAVWKWAQQVL